MMVVTWEGVGMGGIIGNRRGQREKQNVENGNGVYRGLRVMGKGQGDRK